jgi:hypothetical protein
LLNWLTRINILVAFVVLMVFHALLYYYQGTNNWFMVALLASLVDTGVLAALQFAIGARRRAR